MRRCRPGTPESGQAIIFFAIVAAALIMTVGLAVEGGRVLVTYRQMQASADMAALAGAQSLPDGPTAKTYACRYMQDNGFDNCSANSQSTTGGVSTTSACVPPQVGSPYSAFTYGSANPSCTATSTSDHYIEVRVSDNLFTIPIFNVPVTLFAHAVARQGIPGVVDFALVSLDPGSVNGIKLSGNSGIVTHGSILANSTNSSSSSGAITTGNNMSTACEGVWFAHAAEPDPGFLQSYLSNATISIAPPGCSGGTGPTSTNEWVSGAGQIADPYGTTIAPTAGTFGTACVECAQPASSTYFYTWTGTSNNGSLVDCSSGRSSGTWHVATENNQPKISGGTSCLELFPGTYPNGFTIQGGSVYINPGVYTLGSDFKLTGGSFCVYGAPACDMLKGVWNQNGTGGIGTVPGTSVTCATASFSTSDTTSYVDPRKWYYYCSPWGFYDTHPPAGAPNIISSVPKFQDNSTPLNGVTLYLQNANVNISGSSIGVDLAFPNPCPGTGSGSGGGSPGVDFAAGTPTNVYSYPTNVTPGSYPENSLPTVDATTPPQNTQVYPNADLSGAGDQACPNPPLVWAGEFGSQPGEHLNFVVFSQSSTNGGFSFTGTSAENWWGVVHTFPCASVPCTLPPTSPCNSCSLSFTGNAGASPNGPPTLMGQIVADTEVFGGSSTVEVFDRPGGEASGPGSALIE